jgi:hypothetical protein
MQPEARKYLYDIQEAAGNLKIVQFKLPVLIRQVAALAEEQDVP